MSLPTLPNPVLTLDFDRKECSITFASQDMSRRNKLQKFAEVASFSNVYENFEIGNELLTCIGQEVSMRGRWAFTHFQNAHPLTLELACGKGEYTLGLAQVYPDRNYIGVDIKGARIWKGARRALELGLRNAAFLRTRIELLTKFFVPGEVAEIWIVFPDPFPRESKANRRLTSPPFLNVYAQVLQPGGVVHLKTDDDQLFQYTLEVLGTEEKWILEEHSDDIYGAGETRAELGIKTFYEVQHLAAGKTIKYLRFRLAGQL